MAGKSNSFAYYRALAGKGGINKANRVTRGFMYSKILGGKHRVQREKYKNIHFDVYLHDFTIDDGWMYKTGIDCHKRRSSGKG